jgi:hypothetical protein
MTAESVVNPIGALAILNETVSPPDTATLFVLPNTLVLSIFKMFAVAGVKFVDIVEALPREEFISLTVQEPPAETAAAVSRIFPPNEVQTNFLPTGTVKTGILVFTAPIRLNGE